MPGVYRAAIFRGSPEQSGDLITMIDVEADNALDARYKAESAFLLSRRPDQIPAAFWVYIQPE
jgi:hypothetical protein